MKEEQTAQQAMESVLGFRFTTEVQWQLACATRESSIRILGSMPMNRVEPFEAIPEAFWEGDSDVEN